MWKKYVSKFIWLLIAVGFLLIPVADERVLPAIPFYPLDYITLSITILSSFLLYTEKKFKREETALKIFLVFLLLLGSALISLYVNDFTLTALGQIKSWLVLPGIAGLLVAFVWQGQKYRNENFLRVWYIGSVVLLCILLPYLYQGFFTFDGRFQGPFTSPNFLASFLVPGIFLSFYFWQKAASSDTKILFLTLGGAFTGILFLTHSFGGWLALAGTIFWYIVRTKSFLQYKKYILLIVLAITLILGAELITSEKLPRILEERSSLASRITIWSVALHVIQDHPLNGIGIGNFQKVYLGYQEQYPPYLEWAVPQPHNIFLALWLQLGIGGFVAMLWLIQKAVSQNQSSKEHIFLQALFVGVLVYGIFDTPLFGNALAFLWWILLAFLVFPEKKEN